MVGYALWVWKFIKLFVRMAGIHFIKEYVMLAFHLALAPLVRLIGFH